MRVLRLIAIVVLMGAARADAAGFASNENFTVFTPAEPSQQAGQAFARQVLAKAEQYRREIAKEWLGEQLPLGIGRTTINVTFDEARDAGLTWAKDDPRRRYHTIYLTTSRKRALGGTLRHEIAHVVLATRYPAPNRLAAWLEEGIASQYDDAARLKTRRQIITWLTKTRQWPRLETVLHAENINAKDQASYSVAASLAEFLLKLEDKETLLEFADSANHIGWDAALGQQYGIRNVAQLQSQWQRWLLKSQAPTVANANQNR